VHVKDDENSHEENDEDDSNEKRYLLARVSYVSFSFRLHLPQSSPSTMAMRRVGEMLVETDWATGGDAQKNSVPN
jgi:hypothetical protein